MKEQRPLAPQSRLFNDLSLPTWVSDEILFSLCSRYHLLFGGRFAEETRLRLFGRGRAGLQHDLPTGIDAFVARTDSKLGDSRSIIFQRTIAPFFLPFYPTRSELLIASMRGTEASGAKQQLGLIGARHRAHHPLKACPECMEADRRDHQIAVWHLAHQSPGSFVCPAHGVVLLEAIVKVNGLRPYHWVLPSEGILRAPISASDSRDALPHLSSITNLAAAVMALPTGFSFERDRLIRTVRSAFYDRGALTPDGIIRIREVAGPYVQLCRVLCRHAAFQNLDCDIETAKLQLGRMFQPNRGHAHPRRWLMLIDLLFRDCHFLDSYRASDKCTRDEEQPPSEQAPGTGSERRAEFLKLVSEGRSIYAAAKIAGVRRTVGRVWCVESSVRAQDVLRTIPKPLAKNIKSMLCRGVAHLQIAASLRTSPETIQCISAAHPELRDAARRKREASIRANHRRRLVQLRTEHSTLCRAHLRKLDQAAYSWLLVNDRRWLESVLPEKRKPAGSRQLQLDWEERDRALSCAIERTVAEIQAQRGHGPISMAMLRAAVPDLIPRLRSFDRLPMTRFALSRARREGDLYKS